MLGAFAAPRAVLVVNTDFTASDGAEMLAGRLAASGWAQSRLQRLTVHDGMHSALLIATTSENGDGVAALPWPPAVQLLLLLVVIAMLVGACFCCGGSQCGSTRSTRSVLLRRTGRAHGSSQRGESGA